MSNLTPNNPSGTPPQSNERPKSHETIRPVSPKLDDDLDKALSDSFPASDPPAPVSQGTASLPQDRLNEQHHPKEHGDK